NRKTKEVLVDLWTVKTPPLGRTDLSRPEVAQSGYRAIDVRQLQRTVQSALPAGVDVNDLAVESDYLHPDSQPAREGYYNSIFYEGDHEGPSLISDLWFTPGGRNPTDQGNALDSNKTGNLAFLLGKAFSSDKRAEVEQPFLTDLSSVLTEKALLMV